MRPSGVSRLYRYLHHACLFSRETIRRSEKYVSKIEKEFVLLGVLTPAAIAHQVSERSHEAASERKLTMDKNQISRGTHAGVLFTANRQLPWARIFFLGLFLALCLASLQPRASAHGADRRLGQDRAGTTSSQPSASAQYAPTCEQLLVECLAHGGGAICLDQYDACENGG